MRELSHVLINQSPLEPLVLGESRAACLCDSGRRAGGRFICMGLQG
jgi:hypothetical protein